MDMHEASEYRVKGRGGMRRDGCQRGGIREGCLTSLILFNIYHQAVPRQQSEMRGTDGREEKESVEVDAR